MMSEATQAPNEDLLILHHDEVKVKLYRKKGEKRIILELTIDGNFVDDIDLSKRQTLQEWAEKLFEERKAEILHVAESSLLSLPPVIRFLTDEQPCPEHINGDLVFECPACGRQISSHNYTNLFPFEAAYTSHLGSHR